MNAVSLKMLSPRTVTLSERASSVPAWVCAATESADAESVAMSPATGGPASPNVGIVASLPQAASSASAAASPTFVRVLMVSLSFA